MSHGGGGGAKERGGGFSGLNDKPDTDGQSYPTNPNTSQGSRLDAMNNPRKSISDDIIV